MGVGRMGVRAGAGDVIRIVFYISYWNIQYIYIYFQIYHFVKFYENANLINTRFVINNLAEARAYTYDNSLHICCSVIYIEIKSIITHTPNALIPISVEFHFRSFVFTQHPQLYTSVQNVRACAS